MDQTSFYGNLGWTQEKARLIVCPVCETEHWVTTNSISDCDVCKFDFQSKGQD